MSCDIRKKERFVCRILYSPSCPSERDTVKMKMALEQMWNDTDKVKP